MSGVGAPDGQVAWPEASSMETMLEAVSRLRVDGYEFDVGVLPDRRLRCGSCGATAHASSVAVEGTVRFEGESNPDDEQILLALVTPCGHRGLFTTAYGPAADFDVGEVLRALPVLPFVSPGPTGGERPPGPLTGSG